MKIGIPSTLALGALFAMLAVVLGAFAAHGLKDRLSEYSLGIFNTGAQYQMYHALALIATGIIAQQFRLDLSWAALSFSLGIILFSGSLYALSLSGIRVLGAITPIGGVLFIVGWAVLIYKIVSAKA